MSRLSDGSRLSSGHIDAHPLRGGPLWGNAGSEDDELHGQLSGWALLRRGEHEQHVWHLP